MKRLIPRFSRAGTNTNSKATRPGATTGTLVVGVAAILALGATASEMTWGSVTDFFSDFMSDEEELTYLTIDAVEDVFEHRILERGEIESSKNVEVRCQVRSRSSSGVQILKIVPEGATVEKDDPLVTLDDAQLQTEKIQQQIVVSNSESQVIEAQAALDAADLSLKEYEHGTFQELVEQQESLVFVAEENKRRAEEYLEYSKRLANRGYIPEAQLEADTFAVEKARKELGVAKTKLRVLRDYTKAKMLKQLQADIDTATARLKSRKKTLELDRVRLTEIEDQIAKCEILSPAAGEVVYANDQDRRGSSGDLLIAEGRPVRERQVIIRIPDDSKMRVVAKVHESRIGFVRPGMQTDIVIESMPDLKLTGEVVSVNEYPIPSYSVYMAHIKEYAVQIDIHNPPDGLRPGMTANVDVLSERIERAIQVPNHSVVGRNGRFFCAVPTDAGLETREIKVGSSNEEMLVVTDGLEPGETIVLQPNAERILEQLDLPEDENVVEKTADEPVAPASSSGKFKPKKIKKNGKP